MPRVREALRVPHARRPVARVSRLQGRRPAEADVGLRGAVEHAGKVVLRPADDRVRRGGLQFVRRPTRAGCLLDELVIGHENTQQTVLFVFVLSWFRGYMLSNR